MKTEFCTTCKTDPQFIDGSCVVCYYKARKAFMNEMGGPFNTPGDEWLRTRHAPPAGSEARRIFDYCCPPTIVRNFAGSTIWVR